MLELRMSSVFMYVYIPLQLRTEKEKQTPVIETSLQTSTVPVRTRRLVSFVCWLVAVALCGHIPKMNLSNGTHRPQAW